MVTRTVAALYDVHGNLPALDAALAAAEGGGAEVVVFGGDLVPGPQPREVVERAMSLGTRAHCIRGNGDRLVVDAFDGRPGDRLPGAVRETLRWCAARLERGHRDFLAELPETLALEVAGLGAVLFCHATPRGDEELFTRLTPDDRVRPMLAGVAARVVVCGHTHMQFDRVVDGVRVVNAGSVGLPFGDDRAHWLRLGPAVRHARTAYDRDALAVAARGAGYAGVAELLNRPGEEAALAMFERAIEKTPST